MSFDETGALKAEIERLREHNRLLKRNLTAEHARAEAEVKRCEEFRVLADEQMNLIRDLKEMIEASQERERKK